jgi:hypothetical protein
MDKNMRTRKVFAGVVAIVLLGTLVIVTGCRDSKPTDSPVLPPSPLDTPGGSPIAPPPQEARIPGPAFAIDLPLQPGATRISGQGPVSIPIVVVDVTMTGLELGSGFIDENGRFDIELNSPLPGGHRVGILAGTTHPMSAEEVQAYMETLYPWKGKGARDLPHVGTLFDSAMVEE